MPIRPENKTRYPKDWKAISLRIRERAGWRDPVHAPKDGSPLEMIEAGSTGIHQGLYMGDWPDGGWWIADGGDFWPSRPVLARPSRAHLMKDQTNDG